jgi:hypothetical protein
MEKFTLAMKSNSIYTFAPIIFGAREKVPTFNSAKVAQQWMP